MPRVTRRAALTGLAALTAPGAAWAGPTADEPGGTPAEIEAYAEAHRRHFGLPGMVLVLVDAARPRPMISALGLSDVKTGARLDPAQLFEVGSISKSMTSLAVLRAVAAGRFGLEDPLDQVLPAARIEAARPPRILDVLHHASGLPDDAPLAPRPTGGVLWTGFEPGSSWSYSNTGYTLLGLALERLHGAPLSAVLAREVFGPLRLSGARSAIRASERALYPASYWPSDLSRPYPRGGALSEAAFPDFTSGAGCAAFPAAAMARYLAFLMRAGRGDGAGLIPDALAARFTGDAVPAPAWGSSGARYALGLALETDEGRTLLHHTGGMLSFSSSLHVDPEAGVAAFASVNVGMTGYRPRAVTRYAVRLLRARKAGRPAPSPPPVEAPVEDAETLVGRFEASGGAPLEVRSAGGRLEALYRGRSAELQSLGGRRFLTRHPDLGDYPLVAEPAAGRVRLIAYGGASFVRDGAVPPPEPPAELKRLEGRYDNALGEAVRIVARGSSLLVDGAEPLTPLPSGAWRVGGPNGTERVWFDAALEGRPQRLSWSGADHTRTAEG